MNIDYVRKLQNGRVAALRKMQENQFRVPPASRTGLFPDAEACRAQIRILSTHIDLANLHPAV